MSQNGGQDRNAFEFDYYRFCNLLCPLWTMYMSSLVVGTATAKVLVVDNTQLTSAHASYHSNLSNIAQFLVINQLHCDICAYFVVLRS